MSMSLMNGFLSDEQDKDFTDVFKESLTASKFLKRFLPKPDDYMHFSGSDCWVEIRNKNGKLWLEVGEAAA